KALWFRSLRVWYSNLFRVSGFGFRIWSSLLSKRSVDHPRRQRPRRRAALLARPAQSRIHRDTVFLHVHLRLPLLLLLRLHLQLHHPLLRLVRELRARIAALDDLVAEIRRPRMAGAVVELRGVVVLLRLHQ